MSEFVAFIPVRGGSKSIPLKNIKEIAGQPLVYWTIDAAVNCKYIDKVYVSTDTDEIKDIVLRYKKRNFGKLHCIDRSFETATDEATTESAMLEFAHKYEFNNVILIQATSPLLNTDDLNKAIKKFKRNSFDSLLSVTEQKRFIWKINSGGTVLPQNYEIDKRPRRQEQQGYLVENGAFYITHKDLLINTKQRVSGKIGYYRMSEETYFEIDEDSDWIIVEQLLKQRKKEIKENYSNVKLFAMDCDGVLTDAGMYYTENGDEIKKFNTKDGMGISALHKKGIKTAIITREDTKIVKSRAEKLNITNVFQGVNDKVLVMEQLLQKYNLTYEEVAFIGDDINDLELLKRVKYSFAVNDAVDEVKDSVDYITKLKGGQGAVREAIDHLLGCQKGDN